MDTQQPVDSFTVHRGRIPVQAFTSAPHVFQTIARAADGLKHCNIIADIDNTMVVSEKTVKSRPLGSELIKYLTEHCNADTTYVTAREGKSKMTDSTWTSTFFELYNSGMTPTVTTKKNSIVLFPPPTGYARMSDAKKDLAVEMFKQGERKRVKKLFLTIGDCVWDGLGSLPDNPQKLDLDDLYSHKLFGKAYFLFGDGTRAMPAGAYSQFFLLLPHSAQRKMMETPDLMSKTRELLSQGGPGAAGGRASTQKPRSRKKTDDGQRQEKPTRKPKEPKGESTR